MTEQAEEKVFRAVILRPVRCHPERSEGSPHFAQGKLREESRPEYFQDNARSFLRSTQDRLRLLRMTASRGFFRSLFELPIGDRGVASLVAVGRRLASPGGSPPPCAGDYVPPARCASVETKLLQGPQDSFSSACMIGASKSASGFSPDDSQACM